MASAFYCEDLTCPVCLTIFTDPVNLLCGHSFCRGCITAVLSTQPQCPQCRTAVPTDVACLPTSHILKSLAEKAKETEKRKKEKAESAELCPEHEEKLKLFCVTDQQLACIICRDGERHEGHKFKPIKEAAASLRLELEKGMENLCGDIPATESLANTQREEITKTKEKSQQLTTQIHRQVEEMHQFLRKREDEIVNELRNREKDAVEKMTVSLNAIETALCESRELERKLKSVVNIEDPEKFLKSWAEGNSTVTQEHLFRPRANHFKVVNTSLSLGPYESHLQFFMWKEMLQVIQPRAELLSLKSNSTDITVSDDGRSLLCTLKSNQAPPGFSLAFGSTAGSGKTTGFLFGSTGSLFGSSTGSGHNPPHSGFTPVSKQTTNLFFGSTAGSGTTTGNHHAFSVNEFTSGQHYWEIEVGHIDYWELGIKDNFMKYDKQEYAICSSNITTKVVVGARPRKIGIHLNCTSKTLSFYDADNMTHIHTVSPSVMSVPLSAYFNISATAPDPNPLTVCWY
ncbi:E3 ubiquitin-protein ligase TRIM39-like isoform X2 [Sander lucioperca]|uniref:E3 ubiquitin-protein ligase TRIM39-like isoform X2 n=1 Tax=Sander lucioperca TaxID=283035 RepID=UPI00165386F8|nr:E3 ubiquitin-protein ligase TRIM39-like isoform X2 [Sander lucioperca]